MRLVVLLPLLAALSAGCYWLLSSVQDPPGDVGLEVVTAPEPENRAAPNGNTTPTPSGGLEVRYAATPYTVTGSTDRELLASLRAHGPRSDDGEWFFGLTETEMDLTYRLADLEAGCAVTDVRLGLEVAVSLPEWSAQADAGRTLVRDWRRFHRALSRHEATHREIAEDGAETLFRHLEGLRRDNCGALEAEVRHRLRAAQRDIEGAHRDYDARTGHGRTEGATWPPRRLG